MTDDEVVDLLTLMASFDRRTVGDADVDAWLMAVGDLPFADAKVAVVKHYRESREWLMPADVRRAVRAIREERIKVRPLPAPTPDEAVDPRVYKQRMADIIHRVGNGKMPFRAITAGGGAEPSTEYQEARSQEDRDRVLAQTVPCPVDWCPALAGEPCRPSPTQEPLTTWHPSRLQVARGEEPRPINKQSTAGEAS
ncbi:zinc finger domain-containing protein [Actinomadura rubrisoli]|uniref:DNA-binding phage zinc finger domain-containing protein n=1 Tax=Actinomadura rubrisoli TaxID=2530368 RepID=A0A4R5CF14_9ACTN|nr:hypothetical protein [Actinomadura rubrisoli]TDD97589.1 hypothetical protein E1298_00740 [Actinomadura rubrisoli]